MYKRRAAAAVRAALEDTPVVLVQGPRQSGKSTLVAEMGLPVVTLDDAVPLDLARRRPEEFLQAYRPPIAIDEVQRAPELFRAIKAVVDRERKPGSFLLTGSANVLALPRLADSLAGRMELVDLPPLSAAEIEGAGSNFVESAFTAPFILDFIGAPEALGARLLAGGFPEPLGRKAARRAPWFEGYVRTILERDVRDLSNLEGLSQLPRLLTRVAVHAGATQNVTGLSRETGIPATTLTRYLELLRAVFLLFPVPAWSLDGDPVRLAKSPKMHLVDCGLQAHLLRYDEKALADEERLDAVLQTFVAGELRKLLPAGVTLGHLRTARNQEVAFILDGGTRGLVAIDVRPYRTVTPADARGLRFFAELVGERFRAGFLLHPGSGTAPLGERLWSVPVDALWSN